MKHVKGDPVRWLDTVLRPGDVFIDGGANVGVVSDAAARLVGPSGVVLAVEPDPRNLPRLHELARAHPQITVIHGALTAHGKEVLLIQGEKSEQSSLYRPCVEGAIGETWVGSVKLDQLYAGPVRAVKLDLQGAEVDALKGAWRLLSEVNPQWCVELWPHALQRLGTSAEVLPEVLLYLFANFDYRAHWMDPGYPEVSYDELRAYLTATHEPNEHVNIVFER